MGFFGDVSRTLFGGSKTEPTETKSGFGQLPAEIQQAYRGYAGEIPEAYESGMIGRAVTPSPLTGIEQQAIGAVGQGFAPTEESLAADVSMFMNPYEQAVIDPVQRQAQSEYSILNQALQQAGQMGSNRGFLGASDIEQRRLSGIGQLRQQGYESALNRALQMPQARAQDVGMQLGVGELQRGISQGQRAAPLSALQTYGSLTGALPTSGGAYSYGGGGATQPGIAKPIAGIASAFL